MIKKFKDYISESKLPRRNAAGVAIIWEDKILLVHPTGASWRNSALGIPKGKIELGEDPLNAAVRELREETGIDINPDVLDSESNIVNIYKGDQISHQLIYFILKIESPIQIGMLGDKVSKGSLQMHEIDWAGFVPIDRAYELMHRDQLIILDRARY